MDKCTQEELLYVMEEWLRKHYHRSCSCEKTKILLCMLLGLLMTVVACDKQEEPESKPVHVKNEKKQEKHKEREESKEEKV